ncbi:glycosyltransferase family 2 protein [Candidatus Sumerlaeota bacterium]|nr:glycosyltransferase family 2 protein [Candidatus Sumerlaeota bacterium]
MADDLMPQRETPEISVIVPNWNGGPFIGRCLSSIQHALRAAGRVAEIVLVDDASSDGSRERIAARFPRVRLIAKEHNVGFIESANHGVRSANGKIALLINNSMTLREDCIAQLIAPFDAEDADDLFAVSGFVTQWESGEPSHAWMGAALDKGWLRLRRDQPNDLCEALFFHDGCAAVRRERFLELGGFDPIFAPGGWEDYDMSLRAWTRGWRVLYEPAARTVHLGQAPLAGRYGPDGARQIEQRNRLLFGWMNVEDLSLVSRLPACAAMACRRGDTSLLKAALKAFVQRKAAAEGRKRRMAEREISALEILRRFEQRGQWADE